MSQNFSNGDFHKQFSKNMKDLGLPVPSTLFDSFNSAVAHAAAMTAALDSLEKEATVAQLISTTEGLDRLKVAAPFGATFYVGALIDSLAAASRKSLAGGTNLSDFFVFLNQKNLNFKGANTFFAQHPEMLDDSRKSRLAYAAKAALSGSKASA